MFNSVFCLRINGLIFMSDFNEILIFLEIFSKMSQIPNFMEIRPVAAELFHVDRRTER